MGTIPDLALVTQDWHLGEDDPLAIATVIKSAITLQPDLIILAGDILDCTELHKSQLARRAIRVPNRSPLTIDQEIKVAHSLLSALRGGCPDSRIVYLEGNHEQRWNKVIANHLPHLADLCPSLPALLGLADLRIEWIPAGQAFQEIPGWAIFHGTRCSQHAGKLAMLDWGCSIMQGHSHRLKMYSQTFGNGRTVYGCECGHCHSTRASYTDREIPDWQQGFALLTRVKGKVYIPTLAPIYQGKAILPGVARCIEVSPKVSKTFWKQVGR